MKLLLDFVNLTSFYKHCLMMRNLTNGLIYGGMDNSQQKNATIYSLGLSLFTKPSNG
jgi:hypothetical protein